MNLKKGWVLMGIGLAICLSLIPISEIAEENIIVERFVQPNGNPTIMFVYAFSGISLILYSISFFNENDKKPKIERGNSN